MEEGEAALQLAALKFIYYFLHECAQVCCCVCVEVRRNFWELALSVRNGFQDLNISDQACMAHANSLSHCAAPVEGFILILNFIILYFEFVYHSLHVVCLLLLPWNSLCRD